MMELNIYGIIFAGVCWYLASYASNMNGFYNQQRLLRKPYDQFWMPAFSVAAIVFYSLAFWSLIDVLHEAHKAIACG